MFTIVDAIIGGIVFVSVILGFARGFTRETLKLASWICGGILTFAGVPFVRTIAKQFIANDMIADGTSIVGLFIVFLILFNIISHVLSGLIRDSMLGSLDSSLGVLFGFARGFTIICGFQIAMSMFLPYDKYPEIIKNNRFAPLIFQGSDILLKIAPSSVLSYIQEQQRIQNSTATQILNPSGMIGNMSAAFTNAQHPNIQQSPQQQFNQNVMQAAGNVATSIVQDAMRSPNNPEQHNSSVQNAMQAAHNTQAEAEQIARLQPRIETQNQSSQTDGVTRKQEKALDKFLNTTDVTPDVPIDQNSVIPLIPSTPSAQQNLPQPQSLQ
jgi:membrane protein required for colicin V production